MDFNKLLQDLSILVQHSKLNFQEHMYFKQGLEELYKKLNENKEVETPTSL